MKNFEDLFQSTFKENKDRIFRICRSYTDKNADAEDLFQEVLLNVWKALPSFKGHSNIDTWVYRITLNTCFKNLSFEKKKKQHFIRINGIDFKDTSRDLSGEKQAEFDKLTSCINQLKMGDKSIVLLYLEELPYREIAQVIGISENHVAVKMKRIKTKLSICIKP